MSALGDLLKLLHDADRLSDGFEAEFRDWARPSPNSAVVVEADDIIHDRLRWKGAGPFPRATMAYRRVWRHSPERLRVELVHDRTLVRLGVRNESRWWLWDRVEGTLSGRLAAVAGAWECPPLLDPLLLSPARLVGRLWFEPAGTGVRLGREVILARATPRTTEAVLFEFEFDAENGIVLRRAAFEKGCCVQVTEAITARFHADIDPERFEFREPDPLA